MTQWKSDSSTALEETPRPVTPGLRSFLASSHKAVSRPHFLLRETHGSRNALLLVRLPILVHPNTPLRRKAASIFGQTPRLCSLSLRSLFNPSAQSGACVSTLAKPRFLPLRANCSRVPRFRHTSLRSAYRLLFWLARLTPA